ncbi:MAG: chemotaxis protein CheB [Spirochaetales bacterium]|nr:chemotaxis protein CheB [Spirochaetales bacterium]
MPERFTRSFAERLSEITPVDCKEAEHNERMLPGTVYIAPGNYHLMIKAVGTERILKVVKGPKLHNQRPAVDVLFQSVAENIGANAVGVLLSGMGKDGAEGLEAIREGGGYTIAQDERTSIVFGMPKAAIDRGAASRVLPLDKIADDIRIQLRHASVRAAERSEA